MRPAITDWLTTSQVRHWKYKKLGKKYISAQYVRTQYPPVPVILRSLAVELKPWLLLHILHIGRCFRNMNSVIHNPQSSFEVAWAPTYITYTIAFPITLHAHACYLDCLWKRWHGRRARCPFAVIELALRLWHPLISRYNNKTLGAITTIWFQIGRSSMYTYLHTQLPFQLSCLLPWQQQLLIDRQHPRPGIGSTKNQLNKSVTILGLCHLSEVVCASLQ